MTPEEGQKKNIVTGIEYSNTRARVEIDELLADNDLTNLYLLALEAMFKELPKQSNQKDDWWTFYSLSGRTPNSSLDVANVRRYSWRPSRKLGWHRQHQFRLLHPWHVCFPNLASSIYGYVRGESGLVI